MDLIASGLKTILSTSLDVLPIIVFIFLFQIFVIRQPVRDVRRLAAGLVFTILGLGLFLDVDLASLGVANGLRPRINIDGRQGLPRRLRRAGCADCLVGLGGGPGGICMAIKAHEAGFDDGVGLEKADIQVVDTSLVWLPLG